MTRPPYSPTATATSDASFSSSVFDGVSGLSELRVPFALRRDCLSRLYGLLHACSSDQLAHSRSHVFEVFGLGGRTCLFLGMAVPLDIGRNVLVGLNEVGDQPIIPINIFEASNDDTVSPAIDNLLEQEMRNNFFDSAPQLPHAALD
jgi:hypothetical protein